MLSKLKFQQNKGWEVNLRKLDSTPRPPLGPPPRPAEPSRCLLFSSLPACVSCNISHSTHTDAHVCTRCKGQASLAGTRRQVQLQIAGEADVECQPLAIHSV